VFSDPGPRPGPPSGPPPSVQPSHSALRDGDPHSPAAFRFTYAAAPARHLRAAELLGARASGLAEAERREALPQARVALMRDVGVPGGLWAIGYSERDVAPLIEGTLSSHACSWTRRGQWARPTWSGSFGTPCNTW
jgi:hypothetical protein